MVTRQVALTVSATLNGSTLRITTPTALVSGRQRGIHPIIFLNIFLKHLGNDLLGYAKFPYDTPAPDDGFVQSWDRWGPCTLTDDNGTTATHEIGHYLGLKHTFSPNNGITISAGNVAQSNCPPRAHAQPGPRCYIRSDKKPCPYWCGRAVYVWAVCAVCGKCGRVRVGEGLGAIGDWLVVEVW